MISFNERAKALETGAVSNSSGAAGLLDEVFTDQFASICHQGLHYQSDLNDWFRGHHSNDSKRTLDGSYESEDFLRNLGRSSNRCSNAYGKLRLERAADAIHRSQTTENSLGSKGISRNASYPPSTDHVLHDSSRSQHERLPSTEQVPCSVGRPQLQRLPSIEQVLYGITQKKDQISRGISQARHEISRPGNLQDWLKEISPSGLSQPKSIDEELEALQRSLQYARDFEELFGFAPDSHFDELGNGLTAISSVEIQSLNQSQAALAELKKLEFVSDDLFHQRDDEFTVQTDTSMSRLSKSEQPLIIPEESHLSCTPLIQSTPAKLMPVKTRPPPTKREKLYQKEPLNNRRANIKSIDPSQYYQKLSEPPHSWSPPNANGMSTFQYNEYGELNTEDRFSPEQIYQYLFHHPLNYDRSGNYDIENSRLILWIQATPADAGRRYPYVGSSKCRFQDCPAPNNTIRKGFFRVAFDETTATGHQVDPYHCPGFVHLFCLEKFCDFPAICHRFNVLPDQRSLPEGRNKMAITRDHPEMSEVVSIFMKSSRTPNPWDYEKTLCFQLTSKHLELEPSVRKDLRATRGGNHIAVHKGDIDRYVIGERHKVARRRAAPRAPKRKREIEEEEPVLEESSQIDRPPTKRRYRFR